MLGGAAAAPPFPPKLYKEFRDRNDGRLYCRCFLKGFLMFFPKRFLGRLVVLCVFFPVSLLHAQGFTSAVVVPVAGDPNILASGDFNGDGIPDLVYEDAASGGNLHVLLSNGDGSFRAGQVIALPPGPEGVIDVGDLNGDGVQDLVLMSASPQAVVVLLGKGDGTSGLRFGRRQRPS